MRLKLDGIWKKIELSTEAKKQSYLSAEWLSVSTSSLSYLCPTECSLGVLLDGSTDLQVVLVARIGCLNVELVKYQTELPTGGSNDPLTLLVVWVFARVVRGGDEHSPSSCCFIWV